jgi:cytochrome d ubiquinol oxidase subunit I
MALWLLTVLVSLQAFLGDAHGRNTLEHQPAKLAAIEGIWNTGSRLPWAVFAIPDDNAATSRYEISIPDAGSLILTHDINGTVQGLKDFAPEDRPPVRSSAFGSCSPSGASCS